MELVSLVVLIWVGLAGLCTFVLSIKALVIYDMQDNTLLAARALSAIFALQLLQALN